MILNGAETAVLVLMAVVLVILTVTAAVGLYRQRSTQYKRHR